jgi:hypothetical protein
MNATSRDRRSSLATATAHLAFFAAFSAALSCGRRASAARNWLALTRCLPTVGADWQGDQGDTSRLAARLTQDQAWLTLRPSPAVSCPTNESVPFLPSRPAILTSLLPDRTGLAWRAMGRGGRSAACNPPPGAPRSNWRGRTHIPPQKSLFFELATALAERRLAVILRVALTVWSEPSALTQRVSRAIFLPPRERAGGTAGYALQ